MIQPDKYSDDSSLYTFYEADVFHLALQSRLNQIKSTMDIQGLLAHTLPNILHTIRYSYTQHSWMDVIHFYEALQEHLDQHGYWNEGLTLNQWARHAALQTHDRPRYARYMHQRGAMLHQRGENQDAEQCFHTSEMTFQALEDGSARLESMHMRALVIRAEGRLTEAQNICDYVIHKAKQLHLDEWLAHPFFIQGLLARDRGDMRAAEQFVTQSLSLLTRTTEPAMVAQCQQFLGELALMRGDWTQARTRLEESQHLYHEIGSVRQRLGVKRLLADLARHEGQIDEGNRLVSEALQLASQLGDQGQLARLLLAKAQILKQQGTLPLAIDMLRSTIVTYQATGNARAVTGLSVLLSWWYLQQGQLRQSGNALWIAWQSARKVHLLHPRALLGILLRGRHL